MVQIFDANNNIVKQSTNGFFRVINGQPCFYDYKAKADVKPSQKMADDYHFTIGQPIAIDNGGFAYSLIAMAGYRIEIDKGAKATKTGAKASQPSPFIASLLALMADADAAKAIINAFGLDADADAAKAAKAKAKADADAEKAAKAKAKADAAMADAAKAKADADAAYNAIVQKAMTDADATTILKAMADAAKAKADADAAKAKASPAQPSPAEPSPAEPSPADAK